MCLVLGLVWSGLSVRDSREQPVGRRRMAGWLAGLDDERADGDRDLRGLDLAGSRIWELGLMQAAAFLCVGGMGVWNFWCFLFISSTSQPDTDAGQAHLAPSHLAPHESSIQHPASTASGS